jgi:hypothetical protein
MFFPHLNITQQLTLVRSDFCTLIRVFGLFKSEAHLLMGGFSWHIYGISLEEGLQLGFAHAFLHDM